MGIKDYQHAQRAFPSTGFKTAVELSTVFGSLGKYFGDDAAVAFIEQFNAANLTKMIPCNHCNPAMYAKQLAACRTLATVSTPMARLVTMHGEHIASLAQAMNEDVDVRSRTD